MANDNAYGAVNTRQPLSEFTGFVW